MTIQAQVLELIQGLARDTGTAVLLITHDLGVVAEMCDEVAVMYAGELVERASAQDLFQAPEHPYTVGLMGSIPQLDGTRPRLATIAGAVPSLAGISSGCRFAPRCPFVMPACRSGVQILRDAGPAHATRCCRSPLAECAA